MTELRDIHDEHSAEAAEAWALQNFKCALTSLVEQVDFDDESKSLNPSNSGAIL